MLVSSRRSLILGLGSLIAAPALVKATSLMPLRGYDMDPWAIGYRAPWGVTVCSFYNFPNLLQSEVGNTYSIDEAVRKLDYRRRHWTKVRRSELTPLQGAMWNADGLVSTTNR